jgi:hypothetical protein
MENVGKTVKKINIQGHEAKLHQANKHATRMNDSTPTTNYPPVRKQRPGKPLKMLLVGYSPKARTD